ncbi:hypothetical protein MNBD_PLANCTO02-2789, partial [hydrothermal vent metagenome]
EDTDYLESVRKVYLQLATETQNWQLVPVFHDGKLRTITEIGNEIFDIVQNV